MQQTPMATPNPNPTPEPASQRNPILAGLLGGALATLGSLVQYPLLYHLLDARWFTALVVGTSITALTLVARPLSGTPSTPKVPVIGAVIGIVGSFFLPFLFGWVIVSGFAGFLGGAVSRTSQKPLQSLFIGLGVTFVGAVLHAPITAFVPALVMLGSFGAGGRPRTLIH